MRYAVIYEFGPTSIGAYVPDVPGCVAVEHTLEAVKLLIAEALQFHIESMLEDGDPLPEATSVCEMIGFGAATGTRYAAIYEFRSSSVGADVPDFPGLGVAGRSLDEARSRVKEAIQSHIEGLRRHGCAVPASTCQCDYVDVNVGALSHR